MATKNDGHWFANYAALKAHVAEAGHFCDKHRRLNNWVRYQRKCIKAGILENWKRELFEGPAVWSFDFAQDKCHDNVIYPNKVRLNKYYYEHYSFVKDIQMISK